MIRRGIAAIVVAAALAGLSLVSASPASAGLSDCPAGALCAYVSPNAGGIPGKVYGDNANLQQYYKFANAESLYNHGNNCNVRIYYGLSWSGPSYVLDRGWWNPTLAGTVYWHHVYSNDWCV
jgi:hypothetical protein